MSREMKPSNIEWIGDIPKNWSILHCNAGFIRKNSKAEQDDPVILSLARSGVKVRDISNNEGQLAESYYNYNPVEPGDLLLNPMDLVSGANCSISEVSGVISPAYINLRARDGFCPLYYDYYFKTQYWSMAFFAHGSGVSFDNRWTISASVLLHYSIPVPPEDEQKKIANYLKDKCSEIDRVINETEKSIDTYKKLKQSIIAESVIHGIRGQNRDMKESGIEWIGKIPREWNIKKGKLILKYLERPILESDEVITCFRDGEVTLRSNRREDGFTFSMQETGYQGIEPGDLVVHGMDGFAGAIGISDSRGKGTPVLNVLDSTEDKKYIMFYLRNMAYSGIFIALSTGIRVRSCDTNWNKLKELPFVVPPKDEQEEISEYIENKCRAIDNLIAVKKKFITELESYRQSIVYEYVTGKKEVPEL